MLSLEQVCNGDKIVNECTHNIGIKYYDACMMCVLTAPIIRTNCDIPKSFAYHEISQLSISRLHGT